MDPREGHLRIVILTTPRGMLTVEYLVGHLNVVGILVDVGGRPAAKKSALRRILAAWKRSFYLMVLYRPRMTSWKRLARERHVRIVCVDNINDERSVKELKGWAPDLGIIAGGRLVQEHILHIPRLGILNKHSAILPKYRGVAAEYWCLYNEDFDSLGVTVHYVTRGVDDGPIVLQKKMKFEKNDTPASLRHKSNLIGRELLVEAVKLIETTGTKGVVQNEALATRNKKPTPETDRDLYAKLPRLWKEYAQ